MKKIFILFVICNLFLITCNSFRESAGVNRKVVDEYSVIENPPLVIPPNFNLLPPDQLKSKKIEDVESDLAKEILFGLDASETSTESPSLINEIIEQTGANEVSSNIRENINQNFAGEKSTKNDETIFKNNNELNNAIEETEIKLQNKKKENETKKKKKKRFFFF